MAAAGVGSVTKGLTGGATVAAGGKGGLGAGDWELMGLATPGGRVLLIPRDLPLPTAAAILPTVVFRLSAEKYIMYTQDFWGINDIFIYVVSIREFNCNISS